jgi:hypothetical protein
MNRRRRTGIRRQRSGNKEAKRREIFGGMIEGNFSGTPYGSGCTTGKTIIFSAFGKPATDRPNPIGRRSR